MILKDISFSTPQENIIFDEVLFRLAEQGRIGETLRFWESLSTFIVLGRISNPQEDLYLEKVVEDGIMVLRRQSGGGTVVQGKGCLNFSLVLAKDRDPVLYDLRKSYVYILEKIIMALQCLGCESVFRPISDLALVQGERKFSGNAQRRGRKFILHHGTILYNFDIKLIEKYLRLPKDVPEYRRERPHSEFVVNLNLPAVQIKEAMQKMYKIQGQEDRLTEQEKDLMRGALKTKETIVSLTEFLA